MSIRTIVTRGYGSFGSIAEVVTRGYGVGEAISTTDTHDGGWLTEEELRRRRLARQRRDDEENEAKRVAKARLRSDILVAIDGPMKETVLAAVLPHVDEAKPFTPELAYIDWDAMLADMAAVETIRVAAMLARERDLAEEDDMEVLAMSGVF